MAKDKRSRSGNDYAREVADAIIEQLRQGTAPWTRPWAPGQNRLMPYNPSTGKGYRGTNALWLYAEAERCGYGDTRWLTFRQAQQLGATVRKGEHGTRIQYWTWSGREPVLDDKGQPKRDEKGEIVRHVVQYQRPRVFTAVVFNAAQIDGLPREEERSALPDWERHARAEAILEASGATIHQVDGDRAFYSLTKDEITLPLPSQFSSADTYYGTALHELGHWTGHPSRLAREGLGEPFGSESYAREELRAEIASLMLGDELGIGHDPKRHASYVQSWIHALQEDPREILRAAGDADRITTFVLSLTQEKAQAREEPAAEAAPVEQIPLAAALASERVALAVPYEEKDAAKAAGARWDRQARSWFAPAGTDLAPLERWMPDSQQLATVQEPQAALPEAFRSGLERTAGPSKDDAIHRQQTAAISPNTRSSAEAER
jgi:putative DNA primase/helicase